MTSTYLGKNWHDTKSAFRPNKGQTSYAKRMETQKTQTAVKEREKEMKEEKEAERQVSVAWLFYLRRTGCLLSGTDYGIIYLTVYAA